MDLSEFWGIGIIAGAMVAIFLVVRLVSRGGVGGKNPVAEVQREMHERTETLFRASFPDLQPHFHPARVHEFVKARIARKAPARDTTWGSPPGFPAAAAAEIELDGLRDKVRLVDAAGATLAEFVYEEHAEGGVIRLGKGKSTVNVKGREPRVRYWHPEREFKWTPASWGMKSGLAEKPLVSRAGGTSWEDDTSTGSTWDSDTSTSSSDGDTSTSSTVARGAAAAASVAAVGGALAASSPEGDIPDFGGVESGASSTASNTSY